MVFGISLESNISITVGAFQIESEDFNAKIDLVVAYFHSHIELSSNIKIVRACVTPETHW